MSKGKRRTCRSCHGKFAPERSNQVYCSKVTCKRAGKTKTRRKARQAAHKRKESACLGHQGYICDKLVGVANKSGRCGTCKRINGRWTGLFGSSEGFKFRRAITRAGTIDVFPTLDDIEAFYELGCIQKKATDIFDGKSIQRFNICHRYPLVRLDGTVGLYSRENLTLAPATLNKKNGNSVIHSEAIYGTHYVNQSDLDSTYQYIRGETSDEEIRRLLFKKCGYAIVEWVDSMAFKAKSNTNIEPTFEREGLGSYDIACLLSLWLEDGYYCKAEPVSEDCEADWDESNWEKQPSVQSDKAVLKFSYDWFSTCIEAGEVVWSSEPVLDNVTSYFQFQLTGKPPKRFEGCYNPWLEENAA